MTERLKIHVEVYLAAQMLQREQGDFSAQDLVNRVRLLWDDARPGIYTHTTAHCVANAPLNTGTGYNYLWRLSHGEYRCFDPERDVPHSSRTACAHQPGLADVPESYRWLL
jgi:hypothetical protein